MTEGSKDSSIYSKGGTRPVIGRNLCDFQESTPYKQAQVEPSSSIVSDKTLYDKLLDIDSIHKNSSRHQLRLVIPI